MFIINGKPVRDSFVVGAGVDDEHDDGKPDGFVVGDGVDDDHDDGKPDGQSGGGQSR